MSTKVRSTALYPHPFSRAYWHDAAAELKDTKMLVITALLIALRIALKPFAIPLGPQMAIQTATLATALGAMIFGPVLAIPAAIISDTVGFLIYPNGDYFLPFVLTEIASTLAYALCLYRAKPTATRVIIARFLICFVVNVVLQQFIISWQYSYMGNPEKAKDTIMGIMTTTRIFKNLFFFPVESVVITLFLKVLVPVTARMRLTFGKADLGFSKKQIAALVLLFVVGSGCAFWYLTDRYATTSRSADYTPEQRVEANQTMTQLVLDKTEDWDSETVVCIVDSAKRPLLGQETDYILSVYVLDKAEFDKQVEDSKDEKNPYTMDTVWGYSKSGPKKDAALTKVAEIKFVKNEKTGEILRFEVLAVK